MANEILFFLSRSVFALFFVALQLRLQPTYLMPLKYQHEIDAFNFDFKCPVNVSEITNAVEVFRFSFDPINHPNNFLPNVVFDRINGAKFDYSRKGNEMGKCSRCGASFYYNETLALGAWKNMPSQRKEKLKYTHLAKGVFVPGDGLVTEADDYSHFGFYEAMNENEDYLKTKFENIKPL